MHVRKVRIMASTVAQSLAWGHGTIQITGWVCNQSSQADVRAQEVTAIASELQQAKQVATTLRRRQRRNVRVRANSRLSAKVQRMKSQIEHNKRVDAVKIKTYVSYMKKDLQQPRTCPCNSHSLKNQWILRRKSSKVKSKTNKTKRARLLSSLTTPSCNILQCSRKKHSHQWRWRSQSKTPSSKKTTAQLSKKCQLSQQLTIIESFQT